MQKFSEGKINKEFAGNLVQKIRGMGVREKVGYTDTFASEKDDMLKFNTIISFKKQKEE